MFAVRSSVRVVAPLRQQAIRIPAPAASFAFRPSAAALFNGAQFHNRTLQGPLVPFRSLNTSNRRLTETPPPSSSSSSNQKQERPISPHVTIFKFPISAISSITNRATGMALLGILGIAATSANFGTGCDVAIHLHNFREFAPILVPFAKFAIAWPVIYHYMAGLRHLWWDKTAKGVELTTVATGSQQIFIASLVLAAIVSFIYL